MCFYGVGNHGGGPTRRQLAWIEAHRTALPGLELRLSTPEAFFAAIAPLGHRLPVISGELQHCFPGCYSAMGDIKRAQRAGEHALDQAARAARAFGTQADLPRIDAAWDDLLFTAFHDIVTGTSTPSAWASCRAMQGRARIEAEEALLDITRSWADRALPPADAQRIVVLNTDDTAFDGLVEHESWADHALWQDRRLLAQDGTPVPCQPTQPESGFRVPRLLFPARIPAGGAATFTIRPGTPPAPPPGPVATPTRLANARLSLDLAPTGITALARDGRPLLGPGGITLQLRHDPTDTWTYWTDRFTEPLAATLAGGAWTVEETGPLRASLRMDHRLGTSRLRWTLSVDRDSPALRLCLDVNFDARLTLLQLAIHLPAPPTRRTDAVPGGSIPRPLSPAEYPVQGWSRLATPAGDMALVTQDAFSLSADGTLWQWTLLRSPRMAWQGTDPPVYHGRDTHTDQGSHGFTFLLLADEALPDARLDTAARRLAQPLVTFERTEGAERPFIG